MACPHAQLSRFCIASHVRGAPGVPTCGRKRTANRARRQNKTRCPKCKTCAVCSLEPNAICQIYNLPTCTCMHAGPAPCHRQAGACSTQGWLVHVTSPCCSRATAAACGTYCQPCTAAQSLCKHPQFLRCAQLVALYSTPSSMSSSSSTSAKCSCGPAWPSGVCTAAAPDSTAAGRAAAILSCSPAPCRHARSSSYVT